MATRSYTNGSREVYRPSWVLLKRWMCFGAKYYSGLHAEIVEVEIEVVSPSIVPSGNFAELNRTVTCMVLKANDRRTSCPCHDEFRGPRSAYVRQVALENNKLVSFSNREYRLVSLSSCINSSIH
ncbi:hypothetical protein TNCV_3572421 [Trichonephila clavipes]|nr:hypothetical protein TNCV_3572421 [Trichonephila clavipes]